MVVEDFTFYWSHRLLHTPFLYKNFHKIHHEYNTSVSIASVYAHPIEYTLGNIMPCSYGFLILG
jgi:sterol desaturase/sphingolipid hydroxylase (fatty acid hydroxylase superfamily)